MQVACLVGSIVALLVACAPAGPAPQVADSLSAGQKTLIGRKIWQNECAGSIDGLMTWNAGEEFPSIGIGHFIWYPAGFKGRFEESWPSFVVFARQRGAELPALAREAHSPWSHKAEFQKDFKSMRSTALRTWLAGNVGLQTDFIIARSHAALGKILAAAPASEKSRIEANYRKVSTTSQGTYALIDYVNFKGEGTQVAERYKGQGWGLMQVLGGMKEAPAGAPAAREFAASAKRILSRRIANSPPARGENRWEDGWHNRCDTYAKPL
jgi:hypothetical protein